MKRQNIIVALIMILMICSGVKAEECPRINIYGPRRVAKEHLGSFYYTNARSGGVYRWEISGGTIIRGQGSRGVEVRWSNQGGRLRVISSGAICMPDSSEITISVSKYVKDLPYYFPVPMYSSANDSMLLFGSPGQPYWKEKRPNFGKYDIKSRQADRYFPVIYGKVDICVGDQSNGYYLFTNDESLTDYTGRAEKAIHIRPDGSISDWRPQITLGKVQNAALRGDWISINGQVNCLIHKKTGRLVSQQSLPRSVFQTGTPTFFINDSIILTLGYESTPVTIKHQYYTSESWIPKLSKINVNTGNPDSSFPNIWSLNRNFGIYDSVVWVAGYITDLAKNNRSAAIALINAQSGKVLAQPIMPNQYVGKYVQRQNDSILYIFGEFTSVNDRAANYAAAINLRTGELLDWNPPISDSNLYRKISFASDKYLYARICKAQETDRYSSPLCNNITEFREFSDCAIYVFDRKNGALLDSISLKASTLTNQFIGMSDSIIIAGEYYGLKQNTHQMSGIAGISLKDKSFWQSDARIDSINPDQVFNVNNSLYILGYQKNDSLGTNHVLYKLDGDSAYKVKWALPFAGRAIADYDWCGNGNYYCPKWLLLSGVAEDSTYSYFSFAGSFEKNQFKNTIIRVDKNTGQLDTNWKLPKNTFFTTSIALQGDTLFAAIWGAEFNKKNDNNLIGQSMIAISTKTGQIVHWPFVPNQLVRKLHADAQNIYLSGRFNIISPEFANGFGIIRKNKGMPQIVRLPQVQIDNFRDIFDFTIHDSVLYAAGYNSMPEEYPQFGLHAFDLRTGEALDFALSMGGEKCSY
jgi:hypothetical protein